MSEHSIRTWADLLSALQKLTPEQLAQPAQTVLVEPSDDMVSECHPCIAIGTVDEFEIEAIRSTRDNKRHGEEVVILLDYNPFGEDGCVAFKLERGGVKVPIYGTDGPTDPAQQRAKVKLATDFDEGFDGRHNEEVLLYRTEPPYPVNEAVYRESRKDGK